MFSKTFYEILGVAPDATASEIRSAYQELARIYHPDSNFYTEIIEEDVSPEQLRKFQELTAIYTTLINGETRSRYDASLPLSKRGGVSKSNVQKTGRYSEDRSADSARRAQAYGTFGKVTNRFQPEANSAELEPKRMSEIIRWRNGFFQRLISLFVQ